MSGTVELAHAIRDASAIMVGAGAGLSTSSGLVYSGRRFERHFADFEAKYGFHDMYSGGFTRFESPEEQWAYWSRMIWLNRYERELPAPVAGEPDDPGGVGPAYTRLLQLLCDRDYFVLTTNVDHCFQDAGFDKQRLFYTQGDYGLWQCSEPCHAKTYDNYEAVRDMIAWQREHPGTMCVPTPLVPRCPVCGKPMSMNLRADDTFVQDAGWQAAAGRYQDFLGRHQRDGVLYLELGVGANTPGIIKYPFWQRVYANPRATFACINYGEAYVPDEILDRSIVIDADISSVLAQVLAELKR